MSDQFMSPLPPPTESDVWPPRPSGLPSPSLDGNESGDIREFKPINDWAFLGLLIVTFGYYGIYWMFNVAKTANRLVPDRKLSLGWLWGYLVMRILSTVFWLYSLALVPTAASMPSAESVLQGIVAWVTIIYYFIVVFHLRSMLNAVLERTSPVLRRFSGLGTFFLGVLYLQVRLSTRCKERQAEAASPY